MESEPNIFSVEFKSKNGTKNKKKTTITLENTEIAYEVIEIHFYNDFLDYLTSTEKIKNYYGTLIQKLNGDKIYCLN